MALNITFAGEIFDKDGIKITGSEVRYQAFFEKIKEFSSDSKFNTSKLTDNGQYAVNLGDGDWLTQSGIASSGDKIHILFWKPNTEEKEGALNEWCFIEVENNNETLHINNIKLIGPQKPNALFGINNQNRVNKDIIITDNNSNDDHLEVFEEVKNMQKKEFFEINSLGTSSVKINWGDGIIDVKNPGEEYRHKYTSSGVYQIEVEISNKSGLKETVKFEKKIYWNKPYVKFDTEKDNFKPLGENGLGEFVECFNETSDPDGRMEQDAWNFDWEFFDIENKKILNKGFDYVPINNFKSYGTHKIELTCNFFNGFEYEELKFVKSIFQEEWNISCGLEFEEFVDLNSEEEYVPKITGDISHIKKINYFIDGILEYEDKGFDEVIKHSFVIPGDHFVKQEITYNNGFEQKIKSKEFLIKINSSASFISEEYENGLKFTSTSTVGTPPVLEYHWQVRDKVSNELMAELKGDNEEFFYSYFEEGEYRIILTIKDSANIYSEASGIFTQDAFGNTSFNYVESFLEIDILEEEYEISIEENNIEIEIFDEIEIKIMEE